MFIALWLCTKSRRSFLLILFPGAYAPGFMLSPASQAKPDFLCKARSY